jgi:dephospho-CoA kinase
MLGENRAGPHRQSLDSVSTKLIFFVFCSTFVTAVAISWIAIQATWSAQGERVDQQLPATAARARDEVEAWLAARRDELLRLAQADAALAAPSLESAPGTLWPFAGLAALDRNGRVRATTGRHPPPDAVRHAHGDPDVRAIPGEDGGHAVLLAVPMGPAGDERLLGFVHGAELDELLNGLGARTGTSVLLVDGSGNVLFGPGSGRVPIALGDIDPDEPPHVSEYTDPTGTAVVASALPVRLSDWTLVVESPFDVSFAPVVSVVKRIFVIDVCIVLIFSFLAYEITKAILRPIDALSDAARRIAQGQLEHEIPEPAARDEIGLLIRTFNDMMRELRGNQGEIESANAELREKNLELQRANEVLEQLSITDGLTKLHNHRFFQDHLTREIKRVDRVREPLSMILVDVDDFKSLNDRLGHAAGDELLRRIAGLMNDSIRETDLLARYGGDEFVILTANTDVEGARSLAEKIRTNVAESSFIIDESLRPARTTLSMGVARYRGTRKRFFSAADQALYRAKAQGKNCVVADDEVVGPIGSEELRVRPFAAMTKIVGLSGGIGSGKSSVAEVLAELGAVVIDADAIVHELQAPGSPALSELAAEFGEAILDSSGALDRAALAAIAFRDSAARARLGAIMHPKVGAEMARRLAAARNAGAPVIVLDIPLLFEGRKAGTGSASQLAFDATVLVYVPESTQIERQMKRDGCDRDEALRRIRAQLSIEAKRELADHIIDNSGSRAETRQQVRALYEALIDSETAARP